MLYKEKGISGSTLKLIAIAAMLIDHLGSALFPEVKVLRIVGRIAFPIFAFMLVQGFTYTHDRQKYALRLALFAILSELPFNLLITRSIFDAKMLKQNVIITLLIAFLTIWALEWLKEREHENSHSWYILSAGAVAGIGMVIAWFGRTDYGAVGVLTIVVMYFLRYDKKMQILLGCLVLSIDSELEIYCLLAVIPLFLYNGKKGLPMKYVFYAFYPLHMLIISLLRLYFYQV